VQPSGALLLYLLLPRETSCPTVFSAGSLLKRKQGRAHELFAAPAKLFLTFLQGLGKDFHIDHVANQKRQIPVRIFVKRLLQTRPCCWTCTSQTFLHIFSWLF